MKLSTFLSRPRSYVPGTHLSQNTSETLQPPFAQFRAEREADLHTTPTTSDLSKISYLDEQFFGGGKGPASPGKASSESSGLNSVDEQYFGNIGSGGEGVPLSSSRRPASSESPAGLNPVDEQYFGGARHVDAKVKVDPRELEKVGRWKVLLHSLACFSESTKPAEILVELRTFRDLV